MVTTINGMLPDPAAQRRLARIREHNKNGGNGMDFRNGPRQVLEETRRQVRAVLEDPRYPNDTVRREEATRVAREGQQRHLEACRQAEDAYHAELEWLERQANPAPQRGQRTTAQMMEMQMLRDELQARWERSPGSVLPGYQQALKRGDALAAEVHERFGTGFIRDEGQRGEFSDLAYRQEKSRLPQSARTAVEQMEGLVAEETSVLGGISHQKAIMSRDLDTLRQGRAMAAQQATETRRNDLRAGDEE